MRGEHLAGLPGGVVEALARRGIPLERLLPLVPAPPGAIVLLTGSYATGEATPASDLDFLVIHPAGWEHVRPAGAVNHPSVYGDSYDCDLGGLLCNLELVADVHVEAVCALLDAVRLEPGQDAVEDLPNLQPLEVRLLQRLAGGIVLAGDDRARRWRERIRPDALRDAFAAMQFAVGMQVLEDGWAMGAASPARDLLCRAAVECFLISLVTFEGVITYDVKHLWKRSLALRAAGLAGPRVLAELETAMFLDRASPPADHLEAAMAYGADLLRYYVSHPRSRLLLAMLRPVAPAWERMPFGLDLPVLSRPALPAPDA